MATHPTPTTNPLDDDERLEILEIASFITPDSDREYPAKVMEAAGPLADWIAEVTGSRREVRLGFLHRQMNNMRMRAADAPPVSAEEFLSRTKELADWRRPPAADWCRPPEGRVLT